jgi:hypothetical protein
MLLLYNKEIIIMINYLPITLFTISRFFSNSLTNGDTFFKKISICLFSSSNSGYFNDDRIYNTL